MSAYNKCPIGCTCHICVPVAPRKPTNFERITESPEALAKWAVGYGKEPCHYCDHYETDDCDNNDGCTHIVGADSCLYGLESHLKSEVDDA